MPTPQLDYAAADATSRFIADKLLAQEQSRRLILLIKLLLGVPASFIAPAIIGIVILQIAWRWGVYLSSLPLFVLLSAVLLPLIYWRARRHRTDFLGEAAAEVGVGASDAFRASSYGEWEMRNTWLSWAAYAELFFWGPYVVLEAHQAWRRDQSVALACRVRAIQVVRELWAKDGGVPVVELLSPGESRASLAGALRYLAHHDWIDLSERKDRAWLLTEARERLRDRTGRPAT